MMMRCDLSFSRHASGVRGIGESSSRTPEAWRLNARRGITLLEVVVALAIFLFSIVAIWQLVGIGTDRAVDVKLHAKASLLCQRQLARIVAGIDGLGSASGTFEDAPDWQYEIDVSDAELDGLKKAKVTVKFERQDGRVVEETLTQLVLDPSIRGSTQDQPATVTTTPSTTDGTTQDTTGGTMP